MPVTRSTNLSVPQRNAPRTKLDYDIPFFGSLDTTSDISGMAEESSPDNLNVVYDQILSVMSRKGYTKLLTTPTSSFIGGMYSLYQSTGTRQLVYASSNHLYKYDNAGGSTVLTGTPATFTSDKQWSMDEYQDSIYAGNGSDNLIAYNGTSYTIANAAISPQFVKVHKNRVYCANKNSSTLYFSDAGNPNSFPVNNFILINTNDGQNITGISEIMDNLIIFKDDSVWILTGEPLGAGNTTTIGNLQLRQANGTGGCSAFRTICKVGQTLVFMHHTGIYALQNYSYQLISPLLNKTFKQSMNQTIINQCWAVYSSQEKKYILGYPNSSSNTPDKAIVYDFLTKNYSMWDHIPGSCAVTFKFSGTDETVCMGDPNKGNIYELFSGDADIAGDNGTATDGNTLTLTDSSKNWTVNQFTDCRVAIYTVTNDPVTGNPLANTFIGTSTVTSNTSTTLTLSTAMPVNTKGYLYTIGYFTSYWTSKNFDFGMIGYVKKYRFLNMFTDSHNYNMQFGYSVDFAPLGFQKAFRLSSNASIWGSFVWGNFLWGGETSEFGQANVGSNGRYIQVIFGNNLANQPWRVIKYGFGYKLKKMRPNVVTN